MDLLGFITGNFDFFHICQRLLIYNKSNVAKKSDKILKNTLKYSK